jgi:CubicO group peptidase (beta-lactamase class C family)
MGNGRFERIEPGLRTLVEERGYPGFATLVSRHGEVVHAGSVGWADREAGVPMAEDTICRIYSMTKPVVYTALMTLYEEGRFQLGDPVSKYIPAFGATRVAGADGTLEDQSPLRPMQVRDLFTHTCGLSADFCDDMVGARYRAARLMSDPTRKLEDMIEELATIPLAFQPGTRYHYGAGTDVAAHLIQVLSGRSLGAFLEERLFTPLGMPDTGFGVPAAKRDRLAAMYGVPDLFGPEATLPALEGEFAAGNVGRQEVAGSHPCDSPEVFQRGGFGLFSTARDFLRFGEMLLSGTTADGTRILGRKTLELMHTNHLPAALLPDLAEVLPEPGWGFGLGSRVALDIGLIGLPGSPGDFGWWGAAGTYYSVDPREGLVSVMMTQFMCGLDAPENLFRALVYQAIED